MATEKAVLEFDLRSPDGRFEYEAARLAHQHQSALFNLVIEIKCLAAKNSTFAPLLESADKLAVRHCLPRLRELIKKELNT